MNSSDNIVASIQQKYSLGRDSRDVQSEVDHIELDNIYKRQVVRLEIELQEAHKENEQLRQANRALSCSEVLRNSRGNSIELSRQSAVQQERDDLLRDVSDLARGNRLLSQENDVLTQKYSHLLDVHNRLLLEKQPSGQGFSNENYNNNAFTFNQKNNNVNTVTPPRWSEQARLQEDYDCNKRTIHEMFANLRERLGNIQKEQALSFDSREQWRSYALDLQVALENILRITNDQNSIHESVCQMNQTGKDNNNSSSNSSKVASSQGQIPNGQAQPKGLKPSSPKSQISHSRQTTTTTGISQKSPDASKRLISPGKSTISNGNLKNNKLSSQSQQQSLTQSSTRGLGPKKTETSQSSKKLQGIPEQDENQKTIKKTTNRVSTGQNSSQLGKSLSEKKLINRPKTAPKRP